MGIAVVTGASSGMGREFVKQISQRGDVEQIYAIARRQDRLDELAKEVQTPVVPLALDLADTKSIDTLSQTLAKAQPDVAMLVNCAGFAKFGAQGQVGTADLLSMIDLNVRALVALTELCIPYMKAGALILEVASTAAFQPLPDMNVYAATKAFVLSYSRALNEELAERSISVTAVCPGWTKTEFFDVAEKDADKNAVHKMPFMTTPQAVVRRALKDAKNHRSVSVCGAMNVAHWIFSKIIPDSLIMTIWEEMK
ncbi:SDR family NAD(P)-dependent oxidoreductase [Christensenellaceae bacterium OttesenSCG-928-K19]|nr:SDR family NAD(P)-dependent oxidoreductase [Christensenellaceae bacterium OttesenSCG-928-K19]